MTDLDTIAAVATAPGRGGIGIIRLSGPVAYAIATKVTGTSLTPRRAHWCRFFQGEQVLDNGIVLYFQGPDSFTGEDVVELQGHGGPIILDMLLRTVCQLGARVARPGEFSERAFLNNKLDLAQAEAIADLIDSSTEAAALNATRSLQGEFSRQIDELVAAVTQLRVYIEAAIDFPEEEIDFITEGNVAGQLGDIDTNFQRVLQRAQQGSLLREGMKLVIAGKPNAGKSSLLNALSGQDTAIVTPIEGTTRDVLREHIQIDGMPLHIVDTAGLRTSPDAIEQEGIRRAWQEMDSADRILLVIDSTDNSAADPDLLWPERQQNLNRNIPVTVIENKCDIAGAIAHHWQDNDTHHIRLSARTGEGLDLLRDHLKEVMGFQQNSEGQFSARRRHIVSLQAAHECLQAGQQILQASGAGELLAEDLRQCQHHLGEITGAVTSDDLLGEIFSNFCIGK